MSSSDKDRDRRPEDWPREGVFDAQLTFPAPFVSAPAPVTTVYKRSGRRAPFDKSKVADAIFAAARSVGGDDRHRAEDIANGVAIYLGKVLDGDPPTTDQISDAIEKVLIQMGHAKTALAYARYRDKRARIRKLREGDTRAFLTELAEAQAERRAIEAIDSAELLVRTGADTLTGWDRSRIVEALVRETGLDRAAAELIAMEVEQQVVAAGVRTLTASLVREMVDAKLVEHGFEEHRRRHARLGVPLYDAEQVVCLPNKEGGPTLHDPTTTDLMLAERVKKEFALARVYSQRVADAHLRGDIHICHLGQVDRFAAAEANLGYLARHGLPTPGEGGPPAPPRNAEELAEDAGAFARALHRHVRGPVTWPALNVWLAPFLRDHDKEALNAYCRALLDAAARANSPLGPDGFTAVWSIDPPLADAPLVGPGGEVLAEACRDAEQEAQRIAWGLVRACKDQGAPLPCRPGLVISDRFFTLPGAARFLAHAADLVLENGSLRLEFVREDGMAPQPCGAVPGAATAHVVTLNLPRLAYRCRHTDALLEQLEGLVTAAVRAHREKADFLDRLLGLRDVGPLALLAWEREGMSYTDARRARYGLDLCGMNECVQALTGRQLHESEEALEAATAIAGRFRLLCAGQSEATGLTLVAGANEDRAVATRLATLDLQHAAEAARQTVKNDSDDQEVYYIPGVALDPAAPVSPVERVRREGRIHEALGGGLSQVVLPDNLTSRESIVNFVQKTFYQTRSSAVVLSRGR